MDTEREPTLDFMLSYGAPGLPLDFPAPPLVLECVTVGDLEREQLAAARRSQLKRLAERGLGGTAGDFTPDMFGQGAVPLLTREWVQA